MDSIFKTRKKGENKISKYWIFSFILLGVIFALSTIKDKAVFAAPPKVNNVINSNYAGNSGSYAAKKHTGVVNGSDVDRYFIQGTGQELKDVITFEITGLDIVFDRIAIAEENYNMSASETKRNYDSYMIQGDDWVNDSSTSKGAGLVGQDAAGNNACTAITNDGANSLLLKANNANADYIGLFCYDSTNSSLKYAYTIRNVGYGLKTIHIFLYNTIDGKSSQVSHFSVAIVVSKPVSDFSNTNGFTWVSSGSVTCGTNVSPTGSPTTNNICVEYVPGSQTNQSRPLNVSIPKEVAYLHDVAHYDPSYSGSDTVNYSKDNSSYI